MQGRTCDSASRSRPRTKPMRIACWPKWIAGCRPADLNSESADERISYRRWRAEICFNMANRISFGVVAAALSADARAAAAAARQAGFSGVQFDAVTASLDLTSLSGTGRREFRHVLTQQDQSLCGLRAKAAGLLPGDDLDQTIWRLDRILETAAGLAASFVCLDLGPLPLPTDSDFD